jgi:prepilin-type processing-associated H-X9-DG protein
MKSSSKGFTFVELLAVVATLALLGMLLAPALAKSKNRSPAAGCLSNLRQLQLGCAMYSDDYHGVLMPNAPAGAQIGWCGINQESWFSANANTNPASYLAAPMAAYVSSNLTIYRCPGDVIPSDNGLRIRSYSMNGQIGTTINFNSGWRAFVNESDLTCLLPKDAFVFCDEHPASLNDGYLQVALTSPLYPSLPASYLDGACGFSFADGHAEIHKWKSRFILLPVIQYMTTFNVASSGADFDWLWLRQHSSCPP